MPDGIRTWLGNGEFERAGSRWQPTLDAPRISRRLLGHQLAGARLAGVWFQLTDPADPADVAAVVELARTAMPVCGHTVVIAIDGPSGSGKTTLAKGVVDELDCPVVHMDQIFPGWDGLAPAPTLLTTQVLEPIARGERAAYKEWDWQADRWGATITLPRHGLLVVEGCGSSVMPAGAYAAVRVWVEAPRALRLARGLARDGEAYAPHWQRWADQEAAIFAADRTRDRADLIIQTGDPNEIGQAHQAGD